MRLLGVGRGPAGVFRDGGVWCLASAYVLCHIPSAWAYLDRLWPRGEVMHIWIGYLAIRMRVTYPDVAYLSGCVLVAGGSSFLCGRNRGFLHVAAELPAIRSLSRVCAASSLFAAWCDITEAGITPVWRWCHAPSLVSYSLIGVACLAWSGVGYGTGHAHGSLETSHVIPL